MFTFINKKIPDVNNLHYVIKTVFSGITAGFLQLMIAFSLASLLFSGPLSQNLSQGVGVFLITTMVSTLITVIIASDHQLFPSMQSSLVLIVIGIVNTLEIHTSKALLPTLLIVISLVTFICGITFYLFGQMGWVQFIRYVPYPVIGGFLAGYGWLLVWNGLSQSLPITTNITDLTLWLTSDYLVVWLPSLIVGYVLVVGTRRSRHYIVLPGILLLSSIIIHMWISTQELTTLQATSQGILIDNLSKIDWILPFTVDIADVDWQAITNQWIQIIMLVVVGLIHMLLNLSSFEVITQKKIDIDREVQSNGIINIIVGLLGGFASFQSVSVSTLNQKIGTNSQLTYFVAAGFIGGILVFGADILSLIPVSVLGGLLIYIGIEFIDTWMIQGWRRFTRSEYGVLLLIMLIVFFIGIFEGFILGFIIMLILFVLSYSRTNIIYRAVSAENFPSTTEYTPYYAEALQRLRQDVYVIELTGYLFFGSSNRIVNTIENRLSQQNDRSLEYLIIDFRRVTGMDSSALLSIQNILMIAEVDDFDIYLCALDDQKHALRILKDVEQCDNLYFAKDLDQALGICETNLLEISGTTQQYIPSTISSQIADLGMSKKDAKALRKYLTRTQYAPEDVIIQQGEPADCVYFLEIGQVSVLLEDHSDMIRLRTINMGSIFGEVGFLIGETRSTTIISNTDSIVWKFMRDDLINLQEEDPMLAFTFENMMLTILAERLNASNRLIQVLR